MLDVSTLEGWVGTRYEREAVRLFVMAVAIMFIFIPMLLAPFSLVGAVIVFVVGEFLIYNLMKTAESSERRKPKQPT